MSNEADKEQKRAVFVMAGWTYSHAISDEGDCEGRTCFRCRLADILFEADAREQHKVSPTPKARLVSENEEQRSSVQHGH